MKVAFDLDDTLVDLQGAIKIKMKSLGYKYETASTYAMDNYSPKLKEELFKMFVDPDIMCHLEKLYWSTNIIKKLKKRNIPVIVITSRDSSLIIETIAFVHKLFNIPAYITKDKLKYLKYYNITHFVEDCPNNLLTYEAYGIKCLMISNKKTPYNYFLRNKVAWFKNLKHVYRYLLKRK